MPERVSRLLSVVLAAAAASCSLFVSLDGLSNGPADAGGGDASAIDAGDSGPIGGEASADGDSSSLLFFDDFNRPDNASIGNGWIEKNPKSWILSNGQVVRQDNDELNFQDNIVYRASSEDILNVQSIVQFVVTGTTGYPQVWTRVQKDVVIQSGQISGYGLSMAGAGNVASLYRCSTDNCPVQLTQFNVTPAIDSSDVYRIRLGTSGTDPVQLQAFIEQQVADGGDAWNILGAASFNDSDAERITSPGSVGFSAAAGDPTNIFSYDDFTRSPL